MLRAGITCVGEFHYVHHGEGRFDLDEAVIKAAELTGIRMVLIETLYCRSGFNSNDVSEQQIRFKSNVDEFIAHVRTLKEKLPGNVTMAVAGGLILEASKSLPFSPLPPRCSIGSTQMSLRIRLHRKPSLPHTLRRTTKRDPRLRRSGML
jgi:hypothetical protein